MREQTGTSSAHHSLPTRLLTVGALLALSACNSLDEAPTQLGARLVIPMDVRAAQQALTKLPPISGGTLAVSVDGRFAIAADPDRDRVSIVDLQDNSVRNLALDAGVEPGRVVTDAAGRAYVALRRAGDVLSIDIASAQILQRVHVCASPRGMAVDEQQGLLHVACAEGRLSTLHAADGSVLREVNLDADLRDVMVRGDHLLVSTFKGARLLVVDAAGQLESTTGAGQFHLSVPQPATESRESGTPGVFVSADHLQPMQPHLAWRSAQAPTGEVVMLHQGASEDVVDISKKAADPISSSPYGGGGLGGVGCGGIVAPAVTIIDGTGRVTTQPIASGPLTVDMAISPFGAIATAQAGGADEGAPIPTTVFEDEGGDSAPTRLSPPIGLFTGQNPELPPGIDAKTVGRSTVMIFDRGALQAQAMQAMQPGFGSGCQPGNMQTVPGQATAVAFTPRGQLLVQSREPGLLVRLVFDSSSPSAAIALGGDSVRDTGHEIFHRDAGGGIACASCHGEGAEDGHTWKFTGLGERRTQALHIGLEGTAPFHWNGDERDMDHLMEDVFVGRMGGVHQSSGRLDALTDWLFALRPPAPSMDAAADAAVRGKGLFESASTGCTNCHVGAKLTNNKNADVGTGGTFQVPSLLGVAYRLPLMHTGCAPTLKDRFDVACGGDKHGNTRDLSVRQLDDMVAYLRTL